MRGVHAGKCQGHIAFNIKFEEHSLFIDSDVKSSRPKSKILASISLSELWLQPRPWPQTFGLSLASVCSRINQQPRRDGPIYLLITGHHTMVRVNGQMIEDRQLLCERE